MATGRSAADAEAKVIGHGMVGLAWDVTDGGSLDRAFARVADEFGGVDILINNAGATGPLGAGNGAMPGPDFT